jgi:uncharacterized membrane protein
MASSQYGRTAVESFPFQIWTDGELWVQILLMVVWALLLAVVVLILVRVLLLPAIEGLGEPDGNRKAMETLKAQFARGEIDEEEFERRAVSLVLRDVGDTDGAMATLQERFARGEIDEAEFRRRAEVLSQPTREY